MTVGSFSSVTLQPQQSEKFRERLTDMQTQQFYRLTCDDVFVPTGNASDDWNDHSMQQAFLRVTSLASDPAKGNKIVDGSLEEAAVALTAERKQIFREATREASGSAEFIDDRGIQWDVKSPLSPPLGQNWAYSPEHQLVKIRHDLEQGDQVLFNLSRVNDKDRDDTLRLLKAELTCQERAQLVILTDPELPPL
jgi:hypothetical protein